MKPLEYMRVGIGYIEFMSVHKIMNSGVIKKNRKTVIECDYEIDVHISDNTIGGDKYLISKVQDDWVFKMKKNQHVLEIRQAD